MARTEKKARYAGLPPLTGVATSGGGQVLAGRFIKSNGDKVAGATGGGYPIAICGAGERSIGVAEIDSADPTNSQFPAFSADLLVTFAGRNRGAISRVLAGAALTAGQAVMSDASGKAVPHTGGTLLTGVVGSNNAITFTAADASKTGIAVTLVDPPGNSVALSVDTNGTDIVVTLATDGSSNPTSTATQVIAAIAAHDTASQLVNATITGASSGAGVVAPVARTVLTGGGIRNGYAMANAANGAYAEIDQS